MASLHGLNQISEDEIIALFEYDMRMIANEQFIRDILKTEGFERLPELLEKTKLLPVD